MQTVWDSIQLAAPYRPHRGIARGVIAGFMGLVVLLTSSCSPAGISSPRLEGRAEQETELSPCEAAYQGAQQDQKNFDSAISTVQRAQASRSAQQHWIDVAANCTGRFAQGSLNSALATYQLSQIEGSTALSDALAVLPSSEIATSKLSTTEASAIALAEDRAGFGIEVLAARSGASADLLALSDNHKSLAQSLVSLHPEANDPREKIYSVQQLLAHPDTVTDSATGLNTTTTGQIEMDTARAVIEAMSSSEDVTSSANTEDKNADSSASSSSSTDSDSSDTQTNNRSTAENIQALTVAARIVASRASTAFALGFPAFDAAVLTETTK
jgi:hypothetical protein